MNRNFKRAPAAVSGMSDHSLGLDGSGGGAPAGPVRRLTAAEIAAEYGERAHRPAPPKAKFYRWNWNRKGAKP